MKKILSLIVFAVGFTLQTFSQTDDGFVTSHLSTSANDPVINSIANGIDDGFIKVQNGETKSLK